MKVFLIAGARPNFMKIAPLIHELWKRGGNVEWKLIHTGQHYDYLMSKAFFEDFDIPEPDYFLNVGSGSHAEQTSKIMTSFESVCNDIHPDLVVVVGDVNSTMACAITAKKLQIEVAHVEAGLRSGDMSMPEEINRILTDSISDYLFTTESSGTINLIKEGKNKESIFFVGNIMIDTLHYCLNKIDKLKQLPKTSGQDNYAVATLHRPSNVDDVSTLSGILSAFKEISRDMVIHFPMHPRTRSNVEKFRLQHILENANIKVLPPLSYMDFLNIWRNASLVLTDSGGIQEETTALGIPCLTIRNNTERPITIEIGTNILVGTTTDGILEQYGKFKDGLVKTGRVPELWDGHSAKRIIDILTK